MRFSALSSTESNILNDGVQFFEQLTDCVIENAQSSRLISTIPKSSQILRNIFPLTIYICRNRFNICFSKKSYSTSR